MAKMNVNLTLTKDYRKNDCLAAQKTNPIQTQFFQRPKSLAKKPGHTLPSKCRVFPLTLALKELIVIFYKAVIARNILKRLSYGKEPG